VLTGMQAAILVPTSVLARHVLDAAAKSADISL